METPPKPLYTYTVEEANALSPGLARQLLDEHNKLDNEGESFDKELEGFVYRDESGELVSREVVGGVEMWTYWEQKYEEGKGFPGVDDLTELTVGQAAGLHPDVKAALEAKAKGAKAAPILSDLDVFLKHSVKTKQRYLNTKSLQAEAAKRGDKYLEGEYRKDAEVVLSKWLESKKGQAAKAAEAAASTPGGGRKGHASTLRGIGKMGPAMLHKELERYEKIKAHLQSKYAHVVPMGETKRYTKEEVESAIKQLKDKIAEKGTGGRRHRTTRRHRRARHTRSTRRR